MFWLNQAFAEGSNFMPPQASNFAKQFDSLYEFLLIASLISCLLVIGGLVYFALKYRRRSDDDKTAYIPHNAFLEFLWSFIPFVIFLICFGWGWYLYNDMKHAPENAMEINVTGQKWSWEFAYKNGKKTFGELTVPLDAPVKLIMTSRDVIHNFFVPAFRVKQDVVPGMYTSLWFEATKLGNFTVTCAEFCGDGHSKMRAKLNVVPRAEFDGWLSGEGVEGAPAAAAKSPADIGKGIYETRCKVCHNLTDAALVGPGFKGIFGSSRAFADGTSTTADENYIRESILNPQAKFVKGFEDQIMPPFQGQLSEEEMTGIIEFLKTLK